MTAPSPSTCAGTDESGSLVSGPADVRPDVKAAEDPLFAVLSEPSDVPSDLKAPKIPRLPRFPSRQMFHLT
jgi:hypothetical protein